MKKTFIFIIIFALGLPKFFVFEAKSEESFLVVINELMWMGSSLSTYDEWIELKNVTGSPVDLSGWYLTRLSSGEEKLMLLFPEGNTIEDFFVISNYSDESDKCVLNFAPDLVDSDVSLVNSQLQIKLYDSTGHLIDAADDGSGQPLAGDYSSGEVWKSMERNAKLENGDLETAWHTSEKQEGFKTEKEYGTPGQENSNSAPVAEAGVDQNVFVGEEVYFDASDSFDPDGEDLVYQWNFGDGQTGEGVTPVHQYEWEGIYTATLFLSDSQNKVSDSLLITVSKREGVVIKPMPEETEEGNDSEDDQSEEKEIEYQYSDKILFNEIFPNPEGSDKEFEFIELISLEKESINLSGWKIFNGSKYFELDEQIIKLESYLVLKYVDTGMYLNNSGLVLQLIDPQGKVINGVEYPNSLEGQSFSRLPGTNSWSWTLSVTEGEENEIIDDEDDENNEEETAETEKNLEVTIGEARRLGKGEEAVAKGFVAVQPGVFGSQYFYLFDGEAGIKIYSSKKYFPDLKIGDYLQASGKISESASEKKINISRLEDIKLLNLSEEFPEAIKTSLAELNDDLVGSLVLIKGTILDSSKTKILFSDDSGEAEIYIKSGTGLNGNDFEEGSEAEVLGIIIPYEKGYRILPRTESDIRITGKLISTDESEKEGAVLGVSEKNEIEIHPSENTSLTKYIIVIITGLVLCGGALVFRWYKARKQTV